MLLSAKVPSASSALLAVSDSGVMRGHHIRGVLDLVLCIWAALNGSSVTQHNFRPHQIPKQEQISDSVSLHRV